MEQELYKVSAPGSFMLSGEYAVLNGKKSVICSINKRVTASLIKKDGGDILIISDLGKVSFSLDNIDSLDEEIKKKFLFILNTILEFRLKITSGFELKIQSDIPVSKGFGSSTALVVAISALLKQFISKNKKYDVLSKKQNLSEIFQISKRIIEKTQIFASGADIAASIYGGVLLYKQGKVIDKVTTNIPIIFTFIGYKTKTQNIVPKVKSLEKQYPEIYNLLYKATEHISERAFILIKEKQWENLGKLLTINQGILDCLMISTPLIAHILTQLRATSFVFGSKISGAGLGDCIISITDPKFYSCGKNQDLKEQQHFNHPFTLPTDMENLSVLNVTTSKSGLRNEKI